MTTPTPDWPDWNPSQHRANAIAATGVPLLTLSTFIGGNNITVPNGTSTSRGPFTVGQIGFEIAVSFSATVASAQPLRVLLSWVDSSTTLVTDLDAFGIRAGSVTAPHVVRMSGRSKGDQLTVTFDNTATGDDATITYVVLQNSRVYAAEYFKTLTWGQLAPDQLPGFDLAEGIICHAAPTVGAGAQIPRELPAYNGEAWLCVHTNSGTTDCQISIVDLNVNGKQLVQMVTDAHGNINQKISLPKAQTSLLITNNNVAAQPIEVEIVAAWPT